MRENCEGMNFKQDFNLADTTYLLSHSVGRPLKTAQQAFLKNFFGPWQDSGREPWADWMAIIENFRETLAKLFTGEKEDFCPQVNLSSALTKIVMSLDRLQSNHSVVLMSEVDFPSMGFALKKALPENCELRFISRALDITDPNVWEAHVNSDVDLVFISHAYSNSGEQAPLNEILNLARIKGCLTLVDVAQSAGIIPLDLNIQRPDFMIGSSVKWLCSGPGAAYLWINPDQLHTCLPKDVGWFSHDNPFEFDIHNFRYNDSALKFWGGTPSIAPYAIANHCIDYFIRMGIKTLREHNQNLVEIVANEFDKEFVSPRFKSKRNGTLILDFGKKQEAVMSALKIANISVDSRSMGMRISPHIYNDEKDMFKLIKVIKGSLN